MPADDIIGLLAFMDRFVDNKDNNMMLWNRKKDFAVEDLDTAAYQEFRITEAFAFKRNMFFVPTEEFAVYRRL